MNYLNEKYWFRLIDNTPLFLGEGFPINALALTDLMKDVHQKNADFRFKARGFSMYPAIHDGDVVTISPIRDIMPEVGDVAAYLHPFTSKLVVHRLRDFKEGFYLGAGDNSDCDDGWIPANKLLGIVTNIERDGQQINRDCYFIRMSTSDSHQRYYIPSIRIKKRILMFGQSPGMKAILKIFLRPLIRSELKPAAYFLIDDSRDDEQGIKKISIDLFVFKWHSAHMEFHGLPDDANQILWWLSGAGIHPHFNNLGLEFELFQKAKNILLNTGISSIWVNIPKGVMNLQHFCDDLGFYEEKRSSSDKNYSIKPKGPRVIMKCDLNQGYL